MGEGGGGRGKGEREGEREVVMKGTKPCQDGNIVHVYPIESCSTGKFQVTVVKVKQPRLFL